VNTALSAASSAGSANLPMALAGQRHPRPLRAAALTVACLGGASGWSTEGHERIGSIAQHLLKGKHRAEARTLLEGDLVEFAGWENEMSEKRPETKALHWHRQTPEWTCSTGLGINGKVHCDNKEAADDSILCVLSVTFKKYAHDAVLREYPIASDPLWNSESNFDWKNYIKDHHFEGMFGSATAELRWMVTLIGDMHQPLHWLRENDYGRDIKVTFRGKEYTLLSFWEDFMPTQLPPPPTQVELDQQYSSRIQTWVNVAPGELFRSWAKEGSEQACYRIYAGLDLSNTSAPVVVTEEVFSRWRSLASELTSRAGQRVAFVLLDLFEHRRHKEAHSQGRGRTTRHTSHSTNLAKNAAIAAFLVPGLLFLFRWHDQNSGRAGAGFSLGRFGVVGGGEGAGASKKN